MGAKVVRAGAAWTLSRRRPRTIDCEPLAETRMRTLISLIVMLLAAPTCSVNDPATDEPVTIEHGTSFGMCGGYCRSVLEIDGMTARLIQTSPDSIRNPRKTETIQLTEAEARRLRALANVSDLSRVEGVHGCPDCADGGAEWVALQTSDRIIRATYEYGSNLEPIRELQQHLRALRERFQ
jgi:hypothetical protein